MHVIKMAAKIALVANGMLPEAALPDPSGPLPDARAGAALLRAAGCEVGARESRLEMRDAERKIRVARWQRQQKVELIGQQDDGLQVQRMERLAAGNRPA